MAWEQDWFAHPSVVSCINCAICTFFILHRNIKIWREKRQSLAESLYVAELRHARALTEQHVPPRMHGDYNVYSYLTEYNLQQKSEAAHVWQNNAELGLGNAMTVFLNISTYLEVSLWTSACVILCKCYYGSRQVLRVRRMKLYCHLFIRIMKI